MHGSRAIHLQINAEPPRDTASYPFATVGDYNESGGGIQKTTLDCVAGSILRSIKSLDIPGKTRISGPTQGVSGCFEASTKLSDCQLMLLQGGAKGHLPAGSGMVHPVQMVQCTVYGSCRCSCQLALEWSTA